MTVKSPYLPRRSERRTPKHTSSSRPALKSCLLRLRAALVDQLADQEILSLKMPRPFHQARPLLIVQILQQVEWFVERRQHILVEAIFGQATGCVASRKIRIGSLGAVERLAGGDVENPAIDSEQHSRVVDAIVGLERLGCEGLEDERIGSGHLGRRCWTQADIEEIDEDGEQDEVDGCKDGDTAQPPQCQPEVTSVQENHSRHRINERIVGSLDLRLSFLKNLSLFVCHVVCSGGGRGEVIVGQYDGWNMVVSDRRTWHS